MSEDAEYYVCIQSIRMQLQALEDRINTIENNVGQQKKTQTHSNQLQEEVVNVRQQPRKKQGVPELRNQTDIAGSTEVKI